MKTFLVSCILYFVFCMVFSRSVSAQILSLDPATATKNVGEEFSVDLKIDTNGKEVTSTDAKLTFDPEILEITNVTGGDFFGDWAKNIGSGKLYVMGAFKEVFGSKVGSGKVATISLKGKKTGSSQFTFVCSTQSTDTNIFDTANPPADIINCSGTKNGNYIIASGTGGTEESEPTSTPTLTPVPTATATSAPSSGSEPVSTPTPTPVPPVAGISWPTVFSLGAGAVLTIIGIALIF